MDIFERQGAALDSPGSRGAPVTPSDDTDLAVFARFLWVGGAGTVVIDTVEGDRLTLEGAQAGGVVPFRTRRVLATGTTATAIVAAW